MTTSCLVSKLRHYVDLSEAETRFLAESEAEATTHQRRATLARAGDVLPFVYVLKSGWVVGHTSDQQGAQFIAEVHHPGDVLGISELGNRMSALTYVAATDVELCALPKSSLPRMFSEFPRLIALFFAFCAIERSTMIDRLRAMGRMSARDCVALFLLQTHARLLLTNAVDQGTGLFSMPLSQELIGNTVGLSTVSVNRAIRMLEERGHLERHGRFVALPQREALAREVDFTDRVYQIDNSWLPLPGVKTTS